MLPLKVWSSVVSPVRKRLLCSLCAFQHELLELKPYTSLCPNQCVQIIKSFPVALMFAHLWRSLLQDFLERVSLIDETPCWLLTFSKHKCVTLPIFLANLTCVGLLLLLLLLYWIKHAEFSAAVPFKAKATNRTNIKAKTISNMFAYITPCKYFGMIQFVQMPIWYIYVYTVE